MVSCSRWDSPPSNPSPEEPVVVLATPGTPLVLTLEGTLFPAPAGTTTPTIPVFETQCASTNEAATLVPTPTERGIFKQITSGLIGHLRWSLDSCLLFFQGGDSYTIESWVYELPTDTLKQTDDTYPWRELDPLRVTPERPFAPTPPNLPGIVELVSVSPSGKRALFFSAETPTPTPLPGGDGVVNIFFQNVVDAWLWENGETRLLGRLETCGPNDYMWTDDENYLAIQTLSFPKLTCQEAVGWLINIPQSHIHQVLPMDTFNRMASIKGFSPNQDKLLFGEPRGTDTKSVQWIYVLILDTLETVKLDTPDFSSPIAWIDNEKLLISYRDNEFDPENIGIFNLQTGELVHLFSQEDIGSQGITWEALSPDKNWLAFASWEGNSAYTLWLMDLVAWEESQPFP